MANVRTPPWKRKLDCLAIAFWVATLLLTAVLKAEAQTKPDSSIKTLTLGAVFQDPRAPVEKHFRPLAAYVARKLSPSGETQGTVVVASSAAQMIKLLEEKRVDFYMEMPDPTYVLNRLGGAALLLRRWKGGIAEYRSLIFTGKERGIAGLDQLRGKIIAFEDAGSTSGYFFPSFFSSRRDLR